MSVEVSNSWNNRLKTLVKGLAVFIPQLGKAVKVLVELFWPDTTESIWSIIKEQVEDLVEKKILEHELGERVSELNGLRDSLKMYDKASNAEKASLLSAIVVQCNELFQELTGSDNSIHLIPVTISHSYLHLTVLKERYKHGLELYTDAKNQDQWEKELTSKVNEYKTFFLKIYPEWQTWRKDRISVSCTRSENPTVVPPFFYWTTEGKTNDDLTGENVSYSDDWNSKEGYFEDVQKRAKQRMYNDADANMMKEAYIRTFSLDNFLPGHTKDKPKANIKVGEISYGPYSIALKKGSHGVGDDNTISNEVQTEKCGTITKIYVWAWNTIDRIQFCYKDRGMGNKFGDTSFTDKPGLKNEIVLGEKHVTGIEAGFSEGLMAKIQFKFNDGTSSPTFGNKGDWGMDLDQEFTADRDFRLVGAEARSGRGPSSTTGVAEMRFIFQHVSLDPSLSSS